MPPSNRYSQVWLQTYKNETITNTFGGAIYVSGNNVPITVIENTKFSNNFGDSGASLAFFRGGGLFCNATTFYLDEKFGDPIRDFVDTYDGTTVEPSYAMLSKSNVIKDNYDGNLPLEFLIDDEFLDQFIDQIVNKDGQVAL